ncbi:JAB domain-containing protein [Aurantiacibacter luteus]|uniref:MPN domain-containing protein n=1 Tax=Aurantiacibacter luteus TaxID=1581420 RepID=A0A0G9MP24_9SPHN|nr:JAB domain-containing protein [Aurantiacibacter luteus]KLE32472.1 hypothetical protein AAW00_13700 [Aurantiacibacter luteus]
MGPRRAPAPRPSRDTRAALAELLAPLIGERAQAAAARLVERFGTLSRIVAASPEALADALGEHDGAASAIVGARTLVASALYESLTGEPIDVADRRLHDYLRLKLSNPVQERVKAIYLDGQSRYLGSEIVARGTIGRVGVPVRAVLARALEISATRLLLAHNHPSGSSLPSTEDYDATDRFRAAAAPLEIVLVDHLVVSTGGVYSIARGELL